MPPASPVTFRSPAAFRRWLTKNHRTAKEVVVCCFKTHAAHEGLTYRQALDEALCFGWIDSLGRRVDHRRFAVRFTPRKPRSVWSRVNVAKVERLIQEGRMMPAGLAAFEARDESRTGLYSFERRRMKLPPAYVKAFRAKAGAWAWFQKQAPWYRRTTTFWVMSAKREETRARRLAALIDCSARHTAVPPLIPRS